MSLLRDCLQAVCIGLLWWYTVPGAEKLSQKSELLTFARDWLGTFGVLWVESLRWTIPPFLCGLLLNAMKRLEILARKRSES